MMVRHKLQRFIQRVLRQHDVAVEYELVIPLDAAELRLLYGKIVPRAVANVAVSLQQYYLARSHR